LSEAAEPLADHGESHARPQGIARQPTPVRGPSQPPQPTCSVGHRPPSDGYRPNRWRSRVARQNVLGSSNVDSWDATNSIWGGRLWNGLAENIDSGQSNFQLGTRSSGSRRNLAYLLIRHPLRRFILVWFAARTMFACPDLEPHFVCQVCGHRRANLQPNFDWDRPEAKV